MKNFRALRRYLPYLALFLLFFYINLGVYEKYDDHTFITSFASFNFDLIAWCRYYWNTWSGRVLCHGAAVWLIHLGEGWFDLINALMQTALIALLARLPGEQNASPARRDARLAGALLFYLLALPYEMHDETDLWRIATVIYLWGLVCGLYCARFAVAKLSGTSAPARHTIPQWIAGVAAMVYVSNCEQAAPVAAALCLLGELYGKFYRKQRFDPFNWAGFGVITAGFLLARLSPGNTLRERAEMLAAAPYCHIWPLRQKLVYSVFHTVKLNLTWCYPMLLLVAVALLVLVWRQGGGLWARAAAGLPAFYFGLYALVRWVQTNIPGVEPPLLLNYRLFDIIATYPPSVSHAPNQWFSTLLGVFVCVLLGCALFAYAGGAECPLPFLLYGAAFLDIVILSFSVSGNFDSARVSYIPAVLLIGAALLVTERAAVAVLSGCAGANGQSEAASPA